MRNFQINSRFQSETTPKKVHSFHPGGKLSLRGYFLYGVKHGQHEHFYPNGARKLICNYDADELNGECREYYINNSIRSEKNFAKDKIHGRVREYHKNGRLALTTSYKNGVEHGFRIVFDRYGDLLQNAIVEHGEITVPDLSAISDDEFELLVNKVGNGVYLKGIITKINTIKNKFNKEIDEGFLICAY